jgi:predicted DCC family thiol-disulfide oxidoreductase YuxK
MPSGSEYRWSSGWRCQKAATMSSASQTPLPVLVFDGDCGFCTTAVNFMKERLPGFPATIPFQWADLPALGLTTKLASSRVWFVTTEGKFGGAAAMAAILRTQPNGALRFLGWLGTVPPWSWAAELGYRLVARYRHKLPGGTPACAMRPAR